MTAHIVSGVVNNHCQRPALALLVALALWASAVGAQTTALTYQGQLTDAGTPANGDYDLQFALFDADQDGTQIGTTQTLAAVAVSNGLFTVDLDFGVSAFPGENRFLEISVRPAGGSSFTTLTPRQFISATPYAIRTLNAATADGLSSTCTGCVQDTQIQSVAGSKVTGTIPEASIPSGSGNYIQNRTTQQANANFHIAGNGVIDGNLTVGGVLNANNSPSFIQNRTTVQSSANFNISGDGTVAGTLLAGTLGIGTTNPGAKVHVDQVEEGVRIQGPAQGAPNLAYATFYDAVGARIGYVGDGSGHDNSVFLGADVGDVILLTAAGRVLNATSAGNVGIGTMAPATRLHVASDTQVAIRGTSDTNRAVEGFSNSGIGVIGDSTTRGVVGTLGRTSCAGTYAVGGCAGSTGGAAIGVMGQSSTGFGVVARTDSGAIFSGVGGGAQQVLIRADGRGLFNGGTQTGGADYAESIPTTDDPAELEPGDVLTLDPQRGYAVRRSREPTSRLLAGVYSTRPAVLAVGQHGINDSLAGEVPVAVLGIVPTKVTDENGPLQIGDLLVTSSQPGHAMKAQPEVANGVMVYPTGAILGKALEPLAQGTGVIKVLVMLR